MQDFGSLFSVKDKTVLITGGSRGIGEMLAAGFLANGAKVYISSRKVDACNATAERLQAEYGSTCISIPGDLSTVTGIDAFTAELSNNETTLDVLINNAGVAWGAPLDEFPEVGWDKVMDTNVKGPFFLTQRLLPLLERASEEGQPARIINVGSVEGKIVAPWENFSYGSSKAALHHLTKMLAVHLSKRNIIVNAIAPGPFPTWMLSTGVGGGGDVDNTDWSAIAKSTLLQRVGSAQDIVGLAIFLSSQASGFTVGEVISCDGGIGIS